MVLQLYIQALIGRHMLGFVLCIHFMHMRSMVWLLRAPV